jgi:hypothetical protein
MYGLIKLDNDQTRKDVGITGASITGGAALGMGGGYMGGKLKPLTHEEFVQAKQQGHDTIMRDIQNTPPGEVASQYNRLLNPNDAAYQEAEEAIKHLHAQRFARLGVPIGAGLGLAGAGAYVLGHHDKQANVQVPSPQPTVQPEEPDTLTKNELALGAGALGGTVLGATKGYTGNLSKKQFVNIGGTTLSKYDKRVQKTEVPLRAKIDSLEEKALAQSEEGKREAFLKANRVIDKHYQNLSDTILKNVEYREKVHSRMLGRAKLSNGIKGGLIGSLAGTALGVGIPAYLAHQQQQQPTQGGM